MEEKDVIIDLASLRSIKIAQPEPETLVEWKSCCFTCHKQTLVYFIQVGIGLMIMIFCIIQLALSNSCETDGLYSGILMLTAGLFLPSPKISE
jgi:hypothetical protein